MNDLLHVDPLDAEVLTEIELTADLMIAASASARPRLPTPLIDQILNVVAPAQTR